MSSRSLNKESRLRYYLSEVGFKDFRQAYLNTMLWLCNSNSYHTARTPNNLPKWDLQTSKQVGWSSCGQENLNKENKRKRCIQCFLTTNFTSPKFKLNTLKNSSFLKSYKYNCLGQIQMLKDRSKTRIAFTSSAGDTPTRQTLLIILRASETLSDAARPRINDV